MVLNQIPERLYIASSPSLQQVSLQKGYDVILKDNFETGLTKGYEYVHKGYTPLQASLKVVHDPVRFHRLNGRVKKHAMTSFDKDKLMSSLSPQLDYSVSQDGPPILLVCL